MVWTPALVRPESFATPESIRAYLDKYCRDNALKTFVEGAMQIYKEIKK